MKTSKEPLKIEKLLDYFPTSLWQELAQEYQVDKYTKKLEGKQVCLLLIYAMLKGRNTTLRTLEAYYCCSIFQTYAGVAPGTSIDHSSIADRLATMQGDYVKALFAAVNQKLVAHYPSQKINGYELVRFDSTLLSLSSKLLKQDDNGKAVIGMKNGSKGKVTGKELLSVKFTVGFDGLQARVGELFCKGNYITENKALAEVVEGYAYEKGQLAVFDRGISRRATYQHLSEGGVVFVSRTNPRAKREVVEWIDLQGKQDETLIYEKDELVYLFSSSKKIEIPLRMIHATIKASGKPICFLTNSNELQAREVAAVYQRRWDIESFFKFLKQELGISHFLVRNENGLTTVLYLALITAMLIYIYKKENEKSSYKIAKIAFFIELEELIIDMIVQEKVREIIALNSNRKE
jgi:TusA-related sulfurtransferase